MHVINIAKIHEHPKYRQIELSMWIRCTYTISNLVRFLLKILKFSYIFIRLKVVLSFFLQETYDRLRTLAYSDTDVFVVCFSVHDSDSLENVKLKWIPEIRQFKPDTPFFIVGTHTDLRHSVVDITNDCVSTSKGKKCAKKWGAVKYLECSSIDGTGLDEVFRLAYKTAVTPRKKRQTWKSFKDAVKRRTMIF